MIIETLFYTQIGSILGFVILLFFLYRLLVKQKDSTIETQDKHIKFLELKNRELENSSPDILTERLRIRLNAYKEEMNLLSKEDESKKKLIREKENQIKEIISELNDYQEQFDKAQELMEEFCCPYCKSPMITREYHDEFAEYNGKELSIEHECIRYECGLTLVDNKEVSPCKIKKVNINHSK
ncbi:hypothetical protein ES705_00391 [subsurface metagenome]|nr:hypothetical protein [Clostridia bacterium]